VAFSETIRLLIDAEANGARAAISRFRSELSDTDGAFNKVRVAGSSAFDFIGRHAATFALGAGGAIAGFAAHALTSFNDTALGAGQLRDALGLTAEEASRFQEVAGDLGIGVEALESTIGRMNRTAATTPEAFNNIGAAIARNKDGSINVQETFLNVVDALNRIPDASARAAAAQQIFGRSWQDISELVMVGADGVREALASVESQKIISDGEVKRAREFRDMMDDLRGKIESLTLAIGEGLSDAFFLLQTAVDKSFGFVENRMEDLSNLADNLWPDNINPFDSGGPMGTLADDFGEVADAAEDLAKGVATSFGELDITGPFLSAGDAIRYQNEQLEKTRHFAEGAATGFAGFDEGFDIMRSGAETIGELTDRINAMQDAIIASLDSSIGLRNAQRDAADQFAETTAVIGSQDSTLQDQAQALDDSKSAALEAADAAVKLADDTATAEGRTLTHRDKLRVYRDELQRAADTVDGPVRDALLELIDTIDAIPDTHPTEISTPGAEGAIGVAGAVKGAVEAIPTAWPVQFGHSGSAGVIGAAQAVASAIGGVDTSVNVNFGYTGASGVIGAAQAVANAVGGGRASGGPVEAGRIYEVGERGRELFVPNQDGTIVPHGETEKLLGGQGAGNPVVAGGGGSGGGNNIYVNVIAPYGSNGAEFGRKVAEAIRDYEKLNGSSWRS
jgi:methyl-accepting chemotaxis protein